MVGRWYLLTIKEDSWSVPSTLDSKFTYLRGQLEIGKGGFRHWQVCVCFAKNQRLRAVKDAFSSDCHAELSRSGAAREYVWKEDTRVAGTQFEFGELPLRRNKSSDWDAVWSAAVAGDLMSVPANLRVQHYRTLRTIRSDFARPVGMVRTCHVFWGPTGTGKSRRAWEEAGLGAYSKDPRTKFWDGYQAQDSVVIDEFRGSIDIAHLLRWTDRYPVNVEVKGSSVPLCASTIWITSNLNPRSWFLDLDEETYLALERRLNIIKFD